jgi:hypothetical protein
MSLCTSPLGSAIYASTPATLTVWPVGVPSCLTCRNAICMYVSIDLSYPALDKEGLGNAYTDSAALCWWVGGHGW